MSGHFPYFRVFSSLARGSEAACALWRRAQMTDSLNHFRKLRVKWHPDTDLAVETDGAIASRGLVSISWSSRWHVCVCQCDVGQMASYLCRGRCQENLHPFGGKRAPFWLTWNEIWGFRWKYSQSVSLVLFRIPSVTVWLVVDYALPMQERGTHQDQ